MRTSECVIERDRDNIITCEKERQNTSVWERTYSDVWEREFNKLWEGKRERTQVCMIEREGERELIDR